jgi:hypothetical protein
MASCRFWAGGRKSSWKKRLAAGKLDRSLARPEGSAKPAQIGLLLQIFNDPDNPVDRVRLEIV